MEDINRLEKENLYQWACKNYSEETERKYFSPIDRNSNSYYEDINSLNECREYVFETAAELRLELNKLWQSDEKMKQIIKTVLVASMKNKPVGEVNPLRAEKEEGIKSYIYNF